MVEYIKRERVLEILHDIGGCGAEPGTWDDGYDSAINAAYDAVQSEPAAGVTPVVHGEWEHHCICSVCKIACGPKNEAVRKFYSYRPNCGAKMDGR